MFTGTFGALAIMTVISVALGQVGERAIQGGTKKAGRVLGEREGLNMPLVHATATATGCLVVVLVLVPEPDLFHMSAEK